MTQNGIICIDEIRYFVADDGRVDKDRYMHFII